MNNRDAERRLTIVCYEICISMSCKIIDTGNNNAVTFNFLIVLDVLRAWHDVVTNLTILRFGTRDLFWF